MQIAAFSLQFNHIAPPFVKVQKIRGMAQNRQVSCSFCLSEEENAAVGEAEEPQIGRKAPLVLRREPEKRGKYDAPQPRQRVALRLDEREIFRQRPGCAGGREEPVLESLAHVRQGGEIVPLHDPQTGEDRPLHARDVRGARAAADRAPQDGGGLLWDEGLPVPAASHKAANGSRARERAVRQSVVMPSAHPPDGKGLEPDTERPRRLEVFDAERVVRRAQQGGGLLAREGAHGGFPGAREGNARPKFLLEPL